MDIHSYMIKNMWTPAHHSYKWASPKLLPQSFKHIIV